MKQEDYFGFAQSAKQARKHLTVVIYDISDNKRRNRMVKYLEGFGYRVQKSAFEAWQDNKTFARLHTGIEKLIHPDDYVKIYRLKGNSETYSWGTLPEYDHDEVIII